MRNAANLSLRLAWLGVGCLAIAVLLPTCREPQRGSTALLPMVADTSRRWLAALAPADDECESRLEFAHVFERRAPLRATLTGTLSPADAGALREALGLAPASVLLFYDARRVVRIAMELPHTPAAADALVRWLAHPEE